jgi:two-component system sensor histidine kinase RegB
MSHDPVAAMALIQGLVDDRFTDIRDIIHLSSTGPREGPAPVLSRRPDINHSLEMVIDNAAQFAKTKVTIDVSWDNISIIIKVSDDGPGFKTAILNRLGQPYNSSRAGADGHMGLGLFISSTMIEGLGGRLEVSNKKEGGAIVTFILPRANVDVGWKA